MAREHPIQHVFVLMLENRSFDHLLGFSGIAGKDASDGSPTAIDDLSSKPFTNGYDGAVYTAQPGADFALPVDPGHSFTDVVEQLSGRGATYKPGQYPALTMGGFISNFDLHRSGAELARVFRALSPAQLPALNALAREFCVCDRWFSSMPGPTMPNRFFAHAASSAGLDDSPDLGMLGAQILTDGFAFKNGNVFQQLDRAELPWAVWEGDELPTSMVLQGMLPAELSDDVRGRSGFRDYADFAAALADPGFAPVYNFIEPNYGELFFGPRMKCGSSMHPVDDVTRGDRLVKEVYETIRSSPHWPESLLIVTFDEHGGFFDHVPPPKATRPNDGPYDPALNRNRFTFDLLGVRVPAVVVSPWVEAHSIDHRQYDHSTIPKTLLDLFQIGDPLTDRERDANSLASLLTEEPVSIDAIQTLPDPAVSGMKGCDEGMLGWLERVASELASAFERNEQPNPVTQTFAHVAVRREVEMSGIAAGRQLAQHLKGAGTQHEVASYIHHTRLKYRGYREGVRSPVWR